MKTSRSYTLPTCSTKRIALEIGTQPQFLNDIFHFPPFLYPLSDKSPDSAASVRLMVRHGVQLTVPYSTCLFHCLRFPDIGPQSDPVMFTCH